MLNLKRQFIWALAVIMLLGINVSAQNSISGFSDMENNWAKQSVGALVELGIINGYSDGTFKPNNTITRSEFTKIIRIAMKYELVTGSSFKDTATSWAKNEIHTVVVNGGIDKVELGESFYPAKNITRLEMAKMIVRSLDLDDKAKDKAGNPTNFSDDKLISSADKGYILIASENKIINGYSDKRFN
ncbi:MAG TPA: S-layer homology domain-containing protein, partial [Patescibacteria group bacterium]|nr:S-layer homology domain-containing protein [Patescibacteria group bacterium]